jgi:hypothetical protein
MASRKKKEEVPADPEAVTDTKPEEVEEEPHGASVTVTWNGGSRMYSKEVHGKDFKALAKEFAEKHGGKVK